MKRRLRFLAPVLVLVGLATLTSTALDPSPRGAVASAAAGVELSLDGVEWSSNIPLGWHAAELAPGDTVAMTIWLRTTEEVPYVEILANSATQSNFMSWLELLDLSIDGTSHFGSLGQTCHGNAKVSLVSMHECGVLLPLPSTLPHAIKLTFALSSEAANQLQGASTSDFDLVFRAVFEPTESPTPQHPPSNTATPSPASASPTSIPAATVTPGPVGPRSTVPQDTHSPPAATPIIPAPQPPAPAHTPPAGSVPLVPPVLVPASSIRVDLIVPHAVPGHQFWVAIEGPGGTERHGTSVTTQAAEPHRSYIVRATYNGSLALQVDDASCDTGATQERKGSGATLVLSPVDPGSKTLCTIVYTYVVGPDVPLPPRAGTGFGVAEAGLLPGLLAVMVILVLVSALSIQATRRRKRPVR